MSFRPHRFKLGSGKPVRNFYNRYVPGDGVGAPTPTNKGVVMGDKRYRWYSDGSLRREDA